ncbi:hypothetical protein [Paenibacillus aestuarii]|uniref:Uncharacterized protein n=1 Tax=Paenibacillus aestuarii TaxID=516965 RepID=A0ABW0KGM8_9BACL|nr:hypothetical protein [Paenibacillus aestuarii]
MINKRITKSTVNKTQNTVKKTQSAIKKTQSSRKIGFSASNFKKMVHAAQRSLNSQKSVVISQTRTISTDSSWVNALPINRNPSWVAPQAGESYLWGKNDPNGPAAVVARRFTILRDVDEIDDATLFLAVDNFAIVLINGRALIIDSPQANSSFFNPGRQFDIVPFLRRGRNDIVIAAFNFPSNSNRSDNNPAGVLARIRINFAQQSKK